MNAITSRLTGLTALLFPILLFIGTFFAFDQPDNDAPDQEWIDYVNDDGKLVGNLIGGYFLIVAAIVFLVFAVTMYQRLRSANADATWSMIALAGGLAFSICLMIGAIPVIAIAGGQKLGSATPTGPELARWLPQVGFGIILLAGGLSAALMVAVTSYLGLRTRALPSWLAYLGFVTALALLAAGAFIPMIVFVVYMLVLGIVLLMRGGTEVTAAA
jgi:hypothetical protein